MIKKPVKLTKAEIVREILKDPDRKPLLRIFYEFFYLFFIYREIPRHYFSRYLFKKRATNIRDYLPNKFLDDKIPALVNDRRVKEVIDNKLYFDLYYRQFDLALPKIIMYNHKNIFVLSGRLIEVKDQDHFKTLLEEVFEHYPSCDSIFIKKTYASSSGEKIFKLFVYQIRTDNEIISEIYSEVTRSEFIFQETVRQHPGLARLNPSCINSLRIDTFIDVNGKADVVYAFIKMSTTNLYVDNLNLGGCAVGADPETGKLKKYGYSPIKYAGVKVLTEHPVTKTVFEDFAIPYFSEAKELAIRASVCMPGLRLIGWDIGIGESGPVLIEGNSNYQVSGSDLLYGGYLKNPVFRKVLQEINYLG